MLATFFLGPQPFGPPKMSLVLRPPVAWSLILRTGVHLASQYLLLLKQFFGRSKGTNYFLLAHCFVVLHQVLVEKQFKVSANHVGSASVIAKIRERAAQTSHFG